MRLRLAELAALASGCSALVFEILFLRLAGLTFGTTQLAASITLGSFMLGLALGSMLAGRWSAVLRRPVLVYLLLECAVGLLGVVLVWGFPAISAWYLGAFSESASLSVVGNVRGVLVFLMISVPATAMGMTLPLWVRVCRPAYLSFGTSLGQLYGFNTLGAVLGVLVAELVLIPGLGLRATALFALAVNLLAAVVALAWLGQARPVVASRVPRLDRSGLRICVAAALAGFLLLALEVLWFRFLHLYVLDSSAHFAWMLATVLFGIALGGLLGGWWLRHRRPSPGHAAALGLLTGLAALLCWQFFQPPVNAEVAYWAVQQSDVLRLCLQLVFLPALGSGVLYAMLGALLRDVLADDAGAAGWLGFSNTLAAASGAILAGFVLLPVLGSDFTLRALVAGYLLLALLLLVPIRQARLPLSVMAAVLAVLLVSLPPGLDRHLDRAAEKFTAADGSTVVLRREGRYQYLQYLRRVFAGETQDIRLVTNGYSMSSSTVDSRRYMQTFAWLPLQLHDRPQHALLISYGLGLTAQALLSDARVRQLDIVDISADTIEASRSQMPGPQPLDDPRVNVIIEDGRFYLGASPARYDLITGEPPPPRARGVVNLYTQEYFAAMRARLNDGGIASYWLPVDQLNAGSSKSITRAFCTVFTDCTLWAGANYNWILMGSRDAAPGSDAGDARLWQQPASARILMDNGHEGPQSLFVTFLADATQLAQWTDQRPALVDDRPGLLSGDLPEAADLRSYFALMDDHNALQRFRASAWVARWLTGEFRASVEQLYPMLPVLNNQVRPKTRAALQVLDALLRNGPLRVPVLWLLGSDLRMVRIADQASGEHAELAWHRAASRIAGRDVSGALLLLQPHAQSLRGFRAEVYLYLLCAGGWVQEAQQFAGKMRDRGEATDIACW